jgi:hypothetical protein
VYTTPAKKAAVNYSSLALTRAVFAPGLGQLILGELTGCSDNVRDQLGAYGHDTEVATSVKNACRDRDGTLFDPCPIDYDPKILHDGLFIDWGKSTYGNPHKARP